MVSEILVGEVLMSGDPFDKYTVIDMDHNCRFSATADFILHCGLPCVEKLINYICIDIYDTKDFVQIYCIERKG